LPLSAYILAVMLSVMPLDRHAKEDPYDALERYDSIAEAIAKATDDGPYLFAGFHARQNTALILAVISYHESGGWQESVHVGKARGDAGASWCLTQRNIGQGKTPEGWTGRQLVTDDHKCFRSALNLAAKCARSCKGRRWLNGYGSGSCNRGGKLVALRWTTFDRWRARFTK